MLSKTELIYDPFTAPQLDSSKWTVAAFPLGNGDFWRWEEPRAEVKTGDGKLEITVNPFTRFNNEVQIFDNPKHLILGTQNFKVPEQGRISFSLKMGAITHNGNPDDFRDGFACFNVLDFASGMVFDFIATSSKIGVIYERLLMPGATTTEQAFTEIIEVAPNQPGSLFNARIDYSPGLNQVDFWFNEKLVITRGNIPAKPSNLNIGMGLITLKPIENRKSVSLTGQGGTGLWSDVKILTSVE